MSSLKDKTILVVDDNVHMRTIVTQILRALPVKRVVEASDGVDALERLRHDEIDAVILDYRMEPLDGVELVTMLRRSKDSPAPQVPVLMMTGHTEKSRVLAARDAGVSGFTAKPISARVLAERLWAVIEGAGYTPPRLRQEPPLDQEPVDDSLYLL